MVRTRFEVFSAQRNQIQMDEADTEILGFFLPQKNTLENKRNEYCHPEAQRGN